ncbi:MAG: VOC family protein, partial [Acidobacteriota bacterium]|nr:VOC family protein [Acidobacteriota bacterium]
SAAVSISVVTENQAETDRLWDALTADGGQAGRCAWLTDRWGVSWQIVPRALIDSLMSEDRAAAERAFQAMLTMNKVDVAGIEAAFRGD